MSDPTETLEQRYCRALIGPQKASVLMTDAYKLSMAQAGFPLRMETGSGTLRKGGPFYIPFDLNAVVQSLLPRAANSYEEAWLNRYGYGLTPAMRAALQGTVKVQAPQKGSWCLEGDPYITITAPSFLWSWLEPLVLMFNFPIQVATEYRKGMRTFYYTCEDDESILKMLVGHDPEVTLIYDVDYKDRVKDHVTKVVAALRGEPHRGFEVGMRSATCLMQHDFVLWACKLQGMTQTSNLWGAYRNDMIPRGTTGHEHQMRHCLGTSPDDRLGYRAIRDARPDMPSFLPDTFDVFRGIDDALEVMGEDPTRKAAMRFDSGDQDAQFLHLLKGLEDLDKPVTIFEDSYTADKTVRNEEFCDSHGYPQELRLYGYGGHLGAGPALNPLTRDRVSAAYKLTCTGMNAVMKHTGSKRSLPGVLILVQKIEGDKTRSMIIQESELPWARQNGWGDCIVQEVCNLNPHSRLSPRTEELIEELSEWKDY